MGKIFLSAGEISGDLHGAFLARALYEEIPGIQLCGIGGERMKAAGVTLIDDLTEKSSVGILEGLPHLRENLSSLKKARRFVRKWQPDCVVFIDNQGFNLNLAGTVKKEGITSFYYFAPQYWLWGLKKASSLENKLDHILAVFRQEDAFYKGTSLSVDYIGHPILDEMPLLGKGEARRLLGLSSSYDKPLIGLLPGSRSQEFRTLFPLFLKTAEALKGEFDFIMPFASSSFYERFAPETPSFIKTVKKEGTVVMQAADLLILSSGTATLEAAVAGTPMIITYKVSLLTEIVARLLVKVSYVGMPNIIAGKGIVPELLQRDLTQPKLTAMVKKILDDKTGYQRIKRELSQVKASLEPAGAVRRAARLIKERCCHE